MIKTSNIKGFTLMELMISLALFTLVTVISTTIFVQIIKTSKLTTQKSAAIDNISTVMEQLAREVRTGKDFSSSVTTGYTSVSSFSFVNYKNENITYQFSGGRLNKVVNGVNYQLTTSELTTDGWFMVTDNSASGNRTTPRIVVNMVVKNSRGIVLERAQTTISARLIYYKT